MSGSHDIQHSGTQYAVIKINDTQQNDIQHNNESKIDTQHNVSFDILSV